MEVDMVDGIRFEIALNALTVRLPEKVKNGVCKFCGCLTGRSGLYCLSCLPDLASIAYVEYGKIYNSLHAACGFGPAARRPMSRSNVPEPPKPLKTTFVASVAACDHCGALFDKWHPKRRFCSIKCTRIVERRRYRMNRNPNLKPRVLGVCQHCGNNCEAYVCRDCKRASSKEYRKTNHDKIRSRKRKYRKTLRGVVSEPYSNLEIAERDGWRCQLCRRKVDRRLKHPDLMSMSIDHIVPISRGGTDVRSNVQLAHFSCNSKKNNKVWGEGEQLRLLG
jgi:5-methylcytosine-specific restriction endonuclease McrA